MTPVRLEPAAPRSRVKHLTTKPLRSRKKTFTMETNPMNPDQTAQRSSLVWVHIVCIIGNHSTQTKREQTAIVLNGSLERSAKILPQAT